METQEEEETISMEEILQKVTYVKSLCQEMKMNYQEKCLKFQKLKKIYKQEKKKRRVAEAELMLLYATEHVKCTEDEWRKMLKMLISMGNTIEKTQSAISMWIEMKTSAFDETDNREVDKLKKVFFCYYSTVSSLV